MLCFLTLNQFANSKKISYLCLVQNGVITTISNSLEHWLYSCLFSQSCTITSYFIVYTATSHKFSQCSCQLCDCGRTGMTISLFTKFRHSLCTQSQQAILLSPLPSPLPSKPFCLINSSPLTLSRQCCDDPFLASCRPVL